MARPAHTDSAQTRARILEVATLHFGRDGYRAATTRSIASDAGVTFATIHYHFGSKADLYNACIERGFDELERVGAEVVAILFSDPANPPIDRAVRRAFRAAFDNGNRTRFMLRAFVFEDPNLAPSIEARRTRLIERTVEAFTASADPLRAADVQVRFLGFGMLVTRFASAATFEIDALGIEAFEPGGVIETYLIDVAHATLVPGIAP